MKQRLVAAALVAGPVTVVTGFTTCSVRAAVAGGYSPSNHAFG